MWRGEREVLRREQPGMTIKFEPKIRKRRAGFLPSPQTCISMTQTVQTTRSVSGNALAMLAYTAKNVI